MTRVYVGRLGSDCRERDLERFFKGFGRIREITIKDGFAFVEFDDYRDADDAVKDLDGRDLNGNRVRVEHSRPRGNGGGGYGYGGGGGGGGGYRGGGGYGGGGGYRGYGGGGGGGYGGYGRGPPRRRSGYMSSRYGAPYRTKYQVKVENLSSRSSWQDLKDFMRQAGNVTYAEAHKDRQNEGIVCFESDKDMQNAIDKLNGMDLNGRNLNVTDDTANSRPDRMARSRTRSRSRSPKRNNRSESRSRSRSKPSRSRSRSSSAGGKKSRSPPPREGSEK